MVQLSILMSAYNETENQITEAINSILEQEFKDFDFLIVNDNPNREDLKKILNNFKLKDERIKIINNSKNLGLAMSLNKAAAVSNASILARMDADDVSEPDRLKEQIKVLRSGNYDLIFSDFSYIDENSKYIARDTNYWPEEQIYKYLPIKSIIHHPTVMMTANIFNKVGGYRDFPCSQDYDLWLRMLQSGCRFYMMNRKLLRYRIRKNNISSLKNYEQKLTIDYIRELYIQRIKNGKDNYSISHYKEFINKRKQKSTNTKVQLYGEILIDANKKRKEKKYIQWLFLRIKVFVCSPVYRDSYFRLMKLKFFLKKANKIKSKKRISQF